MTLLALLLALLVERAATRLMHLREAHWLDGYGRWARARLAARGGAPGRLLCLLLMLLPALPVALVASLLVAGAPALAWLAFASLVLVFSLGPRDLGDEVDDYIDCELSGDLDAARRAAAEIMEHDAAQRCSLRAAAVEDAIFVQSNNRVFGVIFWFVVLGPTGLGPAAAWLFRSSDLLRRADIAAQQGQPAAPPGCAERFHFAMAWLPARLLALSFALAGSFEEARRGWRERYAELPARLLERNDWLLVHVGRAALGGPSPDEAGPAPAQAALRLVQRALLFWLAVIALMSLAAWIA
jgi:AmpE protein